MSNAARLRAAADPVEAHREAFQRAYDRFPAMDEQQRVAWAEKVASNYSLQLIYSTTGPLRNGPYEPADYVDDGLKPESKR